MLFPYTYVPHQMEKMQGYIDFIFFEVWCKAPIGEEFHPDLFDSNSEIKAIMSEFGFSKNAAERGKKFYKDVKAIYGSFEPLSPTQIKQFKKWYWGNNDLKKICGNNPAAQVIRYTEIDTTHPVLSEQLADFFKGLYSHALLGLSSLETKIGKIDDHYKAFTTINSRGKCPFCGMVDLLGPGHAPRDAYDHYLPKATYPFSSINFKNLVPACHHCNSSYKGSKDPCGGATRRKVFYPFSTELYRIDVQVLLHKADHERLTANDIVLTFGPPELDEQITTWKYVYGIEERYSEKMCSSDAKAWVVEVMDEWRWHQESAGADGRAPEAYLRALARHAEESPYANGNFLKYGFLEACRVVGVFRYIVPTTAS